MITRSSTYLATSLVFAVLGFAVVQPATAERLKVGVPTSLTGDAATFGVDIKNALSLMNEKFGADRYELIFEDERCDNRTAVSVAHKLVNIDKVKYALGFSCNATLLAAAAVYNRAGTVALSSCATSGDVLDIGNSIFRLFPSDVDAAKVLFEYIEKRHKKIAILTEQNEYPALMERTVRKLNEARAQPIEILFEEFVHGGRDLRTVLLKVIGQGVEAIFVNPNTDSAFISVVKPIRELKFKGALYAAYFPGSSMIQREMGADIEGFTFANLPALDEFAIGEGKELLREFRSRFGDPQSGIPVVPLTFEAFRIFDLMIKSNMSPVEFLKTTKFSGGFVPDYYFDEHGAVQGIRFQMQRIRQGKAVVLTEEE